MVRSWDEDVPRIIPRTESDGGSDTYGSGHSEVTLGERDHSGRAVGSLDRRSGEHYEEKRRPSSDKDGEDGGEKKPPQPVGFFDPRLSKVRSKAFLMWAATSKQSIYVSEPRLTLTRTAVMLATFILSVMSIYWGVLSHVEPNLPSLGVFVVDFDGQLAPYTTGEKTLVGPQVLKTVDQLIASTPQHLGYRTLSPSDFNNDPMEVREAVYHHHAWAAIIVNPNATALLRTAVSQGNASYDPLGACQVVFVEARDQTTYPEYVFPELNQLQTEIISSFGTMWTRMVMQNTSIPRNNLQTAPQALSPAIGFSSFNLRPFKPAAAIPTTNIGLIYLIIVAFFSFPFYMPIHMKFMIPAGHPPLRFWQTIVWRWLSAVAVYFFLALAYSMVSLAFHIPFNNPTAPHTEVAQNPNAYGRGTFPVYWMINFVGMTALGLACENVAMAVGQPWTALWLIFWVITNVATGFYAIELAPGFYRWGYAWPLHNSKSPISLVIKQVSDQPEKMLTYVR